MEKPIAFVIEDHEHIAQLIAFNFQSQGFHVECFENAELAQIALKTLLPNLILLDLMLPGRNGLETCRILKSEERTKSIPLIMVTAKGTEADIVKGLELGADDYVTKPFSPEVLIARAKALLRRLSDPKISVPSTGKLQRGSLTIDPIKREVLVNDAKLDLTFSEFEILNFLARKPGWVFTRGQIVDAIRGQNYAVTERSIDVALVGLRKKMGEHGDNIETVRGVGYRYKE
ncbi:MAG: DNA-binding response regulator [Proteobacteria bacterium SG_bin7]|nr:MAG: DNA-binding response regulator [Proteobacteria bacterium SG_bin7]